MHHKTHVGFIDAHAKGDGGHYHLQIIALERFLHLRTAVVIQLGMIGTHAQPTTLQARSGVFHLGAAVAVNDTAFTPLPLHKMPESWSSGLNFSTNV